jgi:hypothetical protein
VEIKFSIVMISLLCLRNMAKLLQER